MILEKKEIQYQGKVVFERLVMSASIERAPKVFFEDEACFLFLTKGAFQFRTPIKLLEFSEGDGMLAQCGNYLIENMSLNKEIPAETVSVVGAFFYPEMVKEYFEKDLSFRHFQNPINVSKVNIGPMMESLVESLNYLLDHPSIADENLIINKQKELLILLSKSEEAESISEFVRSLFTPYEYDFKEIIEKNVYANLTVSELAYLSGMSEATFKRKFSSIFHQSPAKYLLERKLARAKALLQVKSKPISEIAYECGFTSPSSFNRAFKKNFNTTPSEFRKARTTSF